MLIDWIGFGQVSAERDQNLSKYFFENGVLEATCGDPNQFLILGRKGAGKTAVFQHFKNNSPKYIHGSDQIVSLSLNDYSWDIHSLLASEGKAVSLSYTQSWKYIIYLTGIRTLNANGINTKPIKKCTKIIEKIYSSPTPSLSEVIGSKLLQLAKFKMPSGSLDLEGEALDAIEMSGGEIEFHQVQSDNSLQSSLNNTIERLSTIFEQALIDTCSQNQRLFVTFDRVDEAWDAESFGSSQKIIAGLVNAAENIQAKFQGTVRPIIFLREDIFNSIEINDKNKLRTDCGKLLAWSKNGLERMILERVNFFAHNNKVAKFDAVADLFDKEQMRQQRKPFDYIMLRSMMRPRDFISFFDKIKSEMIERRDNPFDPEEINEEKLECKSIYNSETLYSEWLIEEISDEWRVQYPLIVDILEAIRNNGSTNLNKDSLFSALSNVRSDIKSDEIGQILRFLFDNSIIGIRIGQSTQWRYKCFFPSQGFVETDFYKVHDGLHKGLNLTEARSKQAE